MLRMGVAFALFSVIMGCASKGVVSLDPSSPVAVKHQAVVEGFKTAEQTSVPLLAPQTFKAANAQLKAANEVLVSDPYSEKATEALKDTENKLSEAIRFSELSKKHLGRAFEARRKAVEAGATKENADFQSADEKFIRLTGQIEVGKVDSAKQNELDVVANYEKVEIAARKKYTLADARDLLSQADKMDADSLVPGVYESTQKELADVESFIQQNPRELDEIASKQEAVYFNAKRCLELAQSAKQMGEFNTEQMVLWVEDKLSNITQGVMEKDIRDRSFDDQVQVIQSSLASIKQNRNFLERETSDLRSKVLFLQSEKSKLENLSEERAADIASLKVEKGAAEANLQAMQVADEKFNTVAALFSEDEAEVYSKDKKLLIRLKGLDFNVGGTELKTTNFPLLSKVRKAIEVFNAPDVLIEGHTDSTGTEKTNLSLSTKRADAVRQYFISNEVVSDEKVTAEGFGSSKPIAPNTTSEGRAKNRRVDVIIAPTQGELG